MSCISSLEYRIKNRREQSEMRSRFRVLFQFSMGWGCLLCLSQKKYTLRTWNVSGDALEIYATMSHMEKELGAQFYRCHRGYLVNLSQITGYTGDTITLCGGEAIYLAKDKYNEFVKVYMRYLRDGGTVCV